jgi:hypothetical protein
MMNNKLQIIETSDYILAVSDEEVKLSNDNIGFFLRTHSISNNLDIIQNPSFTSNYKYKKIIAYQPKDNAPELDLSLLPEIVVEDDVEKLAKLEYPISTNKGKWGFEEEVQQFNQRAFIKGYKSATKVYSEDDLSGHLIVLGNWIIKNKIKSGIEILSKIQEIIQSLKQPKTPCFPSHCLRECSGKCLYPNKTPKWFIAETVCDQCLDDETVDSCYCNFGNYKTEFKTTTINNKTYLVGTYKYE